MGFEAIYYFVIANRDGHQTFVMQVTLIVALISIYRFQHKPKHSSAISRVIVKSGV
jgi:hypothetical protein|tara:strand:+ start:37 stop:204 length:168 start_codon:yes stop_codon:yes gene_type:complete